MTLLLEINHEQLFMSTGVLQCYMMDNGSLFVGSLLLSILEFALADLLCCMVFCVRFVYSDCVYFFSDILGLTRFRFILFLFLML
jgi:hypothetical protein